jgi:lysophospholipase L1-like esterase
VSRFLVRSPLRHAILVSLALLVSVAVSACGTRRHAYISTSVPDESRSDPAMVGVEPSTAASEDPATEEDEPGVLFIGRTAPGEVGTRFEWVGTQIKARFYGTRVSVDLRDADQFNEFEVILDGHRLNKLVTEPGKQEYRLARGLYPGVHELWLWRRTESSFGPTEFVEFNDFGPGGELLPPPRPSQRRMEVIGDSTTVGYGNEGVPPCEGKEDNQNNYAAYASVASRMVGADLVTVAWSGVGVYRNYDEDGPCADTISDIYDYTMFEPRLDWDASRYDPQVIVLGLGNNDYSTRGDPGQPFVDSYIDFVRDLRSQHPRAQIVCLIQREAMIPNITEIVRLLREQGDSRIEAFDIRVDHGSKGCDGHPSVERHAILGQKLAGELDRLMGWHVISTP